MAEAAVLALADPAARDVARSGGKGASLAAMTAAGLPVPPGFIVPAEVFAATVDEAALAALARAMDHEGATALVRETAQVPEEVMAAYRAMGGTVAVRSSAVAEDSEAASHAGQQETFLELEGEEAVRRAVVDCWASFFTERALFYRRRMGSLDDLAMAVVVQRMVPAEKAGVMFTVHPVTKRRDRMLIEAAFGLGEQVVSGERTPDQYVTDRKGVAKRSVTPAGGVLEAGELTALAAYGQTLARAFGGPQDVEWAIAGGDVFLLQSRPVTTL